MTKKDGAPAEEKKSGNEEQPASVSPVQPNTTTETEVKNASASGAGSMGRTDGPVPADERE